MTSKFLRQGYPTMVLNEQLDPPPHTREDNHNRRIPFAHTYHPFASILHKNIRKHWSLLTTAYPNVPECKLPFLSCFRRPENLRDNLVKADIGPTQSKKPRLLSQLRMSKFPCLHCAQCGNVKVFRLKTMTRESSFVIYLIKCPCGLLYIGETTQSLRDRVSKHKSTIRCKNLPLPIPHHFVTHGHTISQLKYQVIDSVSPQRQGDRISLLKKREAFWIHTLETLTPKGLNREYNLLAFI
ncbi:unnamed protein product [Ranitomeya imitator]|uniref:GIY-YIG domain-containing protein n=1 Tax=Ranitomeya imitator TaxID=111125 RepID=A0ABN9MI31_9NEOB|nr:unnamed protein product [Ranitomeya imitator]